MDNPEKKTDNIGYTRYKKKKKQTKNKKHKHINNTTQKAKQKNQQTQVLVKGKEFLSIIFFYISSLGKIH